MVTDGWPCQDGSEGRKTLWPVLTRTVKIQPGVTGRSVVQQHDTGVVIRRLNQSQDADVRDFLHSVVKHPPQVSGLARREADAGKGWRGWGGKDRRENTLRNSGKGKFPPYNSQVKECTCFRGGSLIAFLLRVRSEIPLLNFMLKHRCGDRMLLDYVSINPGSNETILLFFIYIYFWTKKQPGAATCTLHMARLADLSLFPAIMPR